MFDWDRDQDSLLRAPAKDRAASDVPRRSAMRGKVGLWLLGALVVSGFAYERDMLPRVQNGSALWLGVLDRGVAASPPAALPEGLVTYDDARARRYMRGLRLADGATLQEYASRIGADLSQAEPALAPFLRDAQILVRFELARRAD